MTSWKGTVAIVATIVAQMLAGLQSGRALYIGHCHSEADDEHHAAEGDHDHGSPCDSGDACLSSVADSHDSDSDHDHRCRCPHVHFRGESRPPARVRPSDDVKRQVLLPAMLPPAPETGAPGACGSSCTGAILPPDAGPPQLRLAICSVRLLI